MPKAHAKLSPSAADRWIHCPGSIRLAEQCPPAGSSAYADEGTLAHAIAELKLLREAAEISAEDYSRRLAACLQADDGRYWSGEMDEATDFYASLVREHIAALGEDDAVLMVEQRLNIGFWAPGCFGTADAVILGNKTLEIVDLKYGQGIKVHADGNPQLQLYGLGAADMFEGTYDFDTVRLTIVQPRLDHVSTADVLLEDLQAWGYDVVQPAADLADSDDAPTSSGDWCRWCPAKAICRTRAEEQLALARYEFAEPELLQTEEIGDVLAKAEALQKWVADIQEYALQQAVQGEHYDGWKLVEGRSVRKYADDLAVAEKLQATGYPEAAIYERRLLGLTAMEKLVGKKKLTEILGDLIVKPAGKPVLAPESDKRPEISTTAAAAADFKSEEV